jgi:hypothetical protein
MAWVLLCGLRVLVAAWQPCWSWKGRLGGPVGWKNGCVHSLSLLAYDA